MWKQRLILFGWCVLGAGTVLLLIAAMQQKKHKECSAINIEISGAGNQMFVNEKDVTDILKANGASVSQDISTIELKKVESELEKDPWIKNAQLFFDNNQVLQVKIDEREPLARVFTLGGNSFYIDRSGMHLPLSDQQSARVPVFTSFTSDKNVLSASDSALLSGVKSIAQFIMQDSFWSAEISQINITPQSTFEMIPVLGNQIIELGNADSLQKKFNRLYSFYKQVWAKDGFEKYEKIDVQFDNQIVATIRGAARPLSDTAKAMRLIDNSLTKMNTVMKDTTYAAPQSSNIKDSSANTNIKKLPLASSTSKKKILNNKQNKTQTKKAAKPSPDKAKAMMPKHR